MKKSILISAAIFAYCLLHTAYSFPQGTAVNTNGLSADSSAILDVSSSSQGLLIPRMSEAQKNAIPRPAPSLLIYQLDGAQPGYYFNAGDKTTKNWMYVGGDDLGNHTASDSLNMSMNKIVNLATCTQNYDAANKLYVDGKAGAGGAGGGGSTGCSNCITELSYKINAGTAISWSACADSCYNLSYNGNTDWRMPSVEEIVYYRTNFPVPAGGWISSYVWSAGPVYVHGSYYASFAIITESTGYLVCTSDVGWSAKQCRCVR